MIDSAKNCELANQWEVGDFESCELKELLLKCEAETHQMGCTKQLGVAPIVG